LVLTIFLGATAMTLAMRRITPLLLGLLTLLSSVATFSAPLPLAAPEEVGMSSKRLNRITERFQKAIDDGNLPGAVINIAREGKLVYSNALGWQDVQAGIKMDQDSIFRIYSMTKPIVSVAALVLVEQGKLSLTDPISKYIPAFEKMSVGIETKDEQGNPTLTLEPAKKAITVQDLLRHTSGLTYGVLGEMNEVKKRYIDAKIFSQHWILEDFANTLATLPLQYQPGTTWEYGHSTDILGRVIEVASGMTLDKFLEKNIFNRLAMKDTSFGVPHAKHDRVAENTIDRKTGKKIELINVKIPMVFFAGGHGLTSTADDYLRFCQMLLNGGELDGVRILSPKTVRYLSANHLNAGISEGTFYLPGPGYGFGLGFATRLENGQSAWPGSTGEYFWAGYAGTYFWIDPEESLVVSLMTQDPYRRNEHRVLLRNLVYQAIVE
jgi:CubicO group peptidase (beta-lactamase class C family)